MKPTVKLRECRHVHYSPSPDGERPDLHLIKVQEHFSDNTIKPRLIIKHDFKKPIYISKYDQREYKQKRQYEQMANLDRYECTERERLETVARALDLNPRFLDNRFLRETPYLYGNDISSTAYIKNTINKKHGKMTYASLAVFDIETDMIENVGEITMATLSFKDRVVTACQRRIFNGMHDDAILEKLRTKMDFYLKDYIEKRHINWEIILTDNPVDIILEVFKRAHQWQPDYIGIWNINFDLPILIKTLEENNIDPADVFCEPSLPRAYKHFTYKEGPLMGKSNAGVIKNLSPNERWHKVFFTASFQFVDNMCVYYQIRKTRPKLPSYSLDAILERHLGIRKLKFEESNHITPNTPEWHKFMQSKFPFEYVIYNVFDCISVEELDDEILDIKLTLNKFIAVSDLNDFNSMPKTSSDSFYWFALENGYVLGCSGNLINEELDPFVVPLKGLIVTLPAFLQKDNDNDVIKGTKLLNHNVHVDVADSDIAASYPNGISVFNIAKDTTMKELVSIEGVDYDDYVRYEGINLSGGKTNAAHWVQKLHSAPEFPEIDKVFKLYYKQS